MTDSTAIVKIVSRPSIFDALAWAASATSLFCAVGLSVLDIISISVATVLAMFVAALFVATVLFLSRFGLCINPHGEWIYSGPTGRRTGVTADSRAYFRQVLPWLSVLCIEDERSRSLLSVWTCCVSQFSIDQTARRNEIQTTLRKYGFRD